VKTSISCKVPEGYIIPSMITAKRKIGNLGEDIAVKFLERRGFNIIARNYSKPWGEIDIIAEKAGIVRFIEVKSVSREIKEGVPREMGYSPEELLNASKLRKVARTAALYMESKHDGREFQLDAIAVMIDKEKRIARCKLIEQVLDDNL
jgi:putative endonuclease